MKIMSIISKCIQIHFWFITDSSVHFQMIEAYPFDMIGWPSFRNDGNVSDDYSCPSFRNWGDLPLIISKRNIIFFIIYKEKHSEILSFRRVKSSSKTLDRKVINQCKSYANFDFIWVHFAFLTCEPHSNRYWTRFLLIFLYH